MPPFRAIAAALLLLVTSSACGDEIGDECALSTDCSNNGDRICDTNSPGGYCTILGCDFDTCPDEAVCVRFFPGVTSNRRCDPDGDGEFFCDDKDQCCTANEECTLRLEVDGNIQGGYCMPRTAEVRYCMRACTRNGDCRDGYECRNVDRMTRHGGEPVRDPDDTSGDLQSFCAPAPLQ